MPIPPTISEIDAMAPSTMLKIVLVRCSCFSSSSGIDDLEVDHLVVPARQHALHDLGDRRHEARLTHAHDDAVELVEVRPLGLLSGIRVVLVREVELLAGLLDVAGVTWARLRYRSSTVPSGT